MAASLLRIGRLNCIKCLQAGNWSVLSKAPPAAAFSTKSGGSKKWSPKNTSGKKQAKTYFDIEKLVQHKPCEGFPAPAAAVKPTEHSLPSAALPVAAISEVKAGGQVVEASPSSQAIPNPGSTADVTPAVEAPPAGEAVFESAGAAGDVPVVPSEATATVAEAIPVVESMPEAVTAPVEAPLETPLEAKPFESEQFGEAAPEFVYVEAPPVDKTGEPLFKASPADVAPEPEAEALPVDEALEPVAEAVPVSVAQEAATAPVPGAFEPLAEAAPVAVATPTEADVSLTTEAEAETSVPVEIAESVVNQSSVTAEAAGEELQDAAPAEPTEIPEGTRHTVEVFESAIAAGAVPIVPFEATATVTEAIPVVESVPEAVTAPAKDLAESTAPVDEGDTLIVKSPVEAAIEAPVEIPLEAKPFESEQFVEAAAETVYVEAPPVEKVLEPLFEASPVDVTPEPAAEALLVDEALEPVAEAAPPDVTTEPVAEALPVDEALEPVAEAAPPDVTTEPVADALPVDEALEPVAEAAPPDVTTEPVAEALPVDEALEPVAETAPPDVTTEPVAEALPVDEALEPVAETAPPDVTTEPVAEALPVDEALEPVAEAVPVSVAQEVDAEAAPVEEATPTEAEVSFTTEAEVETLVPVEIVESLVKQSSVTAEAAGEELQEAAPAEPTEIPEAHMDPIQKLFLDSIREYSSRSQATGGLIDAGSEYEKALVEEIAKLQRLYGGGDLTSFPEFKFKEPNLDEVSQK